MSARRAWRVAVVAALAVAWVGSVDPAAGQDADGHITGTVTADDGGAPIEGICVSVYAFVSGGWHAQVETDSSGSYDVGGLPTGDYKVWFQDCSGTDTYTDEYFDDSIDQGETTPVAVTDGATTPAIDAGLAAAGRITGTVTDDETGQPLAGICVTASTRSGTASESDLTDNGGFYEVVGLPAEHFLVQFSDCNGTGFITEYFEDTTRYNEATRLVVGAGDTVAGVDAGLTAGGHITGTVTADATDQPLAGICVYAEGGGGNRSAQTDGDGVYDIDRLGTGDYFVQFYDCNDTGYIAEYFDDSPGYDDATRVSVTAGAVSAGVDAGLAAGGHIIGTVTADVTDLPLADICVYAYGENTAGFARTGQNGTYDIDSLRGGSYSLSFRDCSEAPGYAPEYFDDTTDFGSATRVEVTPGETTAAIDAGLAVGARITGAVTADDGGQPLQGICVGATDLETGDGESVRTHEDGTYSIGGLPPGRYSVSFSVCGVGPRNYVNELYDGVRAYEDATLLDLTVGQTVAGIDAGLATAGHITGTVTAEDTGLPFETACAYVWDGAFGGYAETQADGSYDVGGLAAGSYTVRFENCGSPGDYAPEYFDDAVSAAQATSVAVPAGGTVPEIDAVLSTGGHISGTVTSDETGLPLAGICVSAYTDDFGRGSGPTGPDGTYDIGGLPTSGHTVLFEDCGTDDYLAEYYDDVTDEGDAALVAVASGTTITNVDAGLATDGEGDGVSVPIENGAPNDGDGNDDGIPDAEQPNVASLPAAVGQEPYVTLAAPEGTSLREVATIDPASLPEPPPEALSLPAGLLSFTVDGVAPGATIEIEVLVDGGVTGADRYFKFHDGAWLDFTDHAAFNGDSILLAMTDGGLGDDDGEANGRIVDPGGPALQVTSFPPGLDPPPPVTPGTCAGHDVTVDLADGEQPTNGPDVIRGTAGADTINALDGDDIICSLGENDIIRGNQGRDRVFGGGGADHLQGDAGDDILRGRGGDDTLRGRAGADTLGGGRGADTCRGGAGLDTAAACETTIGVP